MEQSIAVVGAGISGAVVAKHLAARGHGVAVFDKGRGPGGRTSSRRTDSGHRFDHGAYRIELTDPALHAELSPAVTAGVLRQGGNIYTSPTGLNAICKALLNGIPAHYSTQLVRIERGDAWTLFDDNGQTFGPFDAVVLAVPPVNAAGIVSECNPDLAKTIANVRMLPRWVAMLAYDQKQADAADHAEINGHLVRRSLSNTVGDALVIQASEDWSRQHVEDDARAVGEALCAEVKPLLPAAAPQSVSAHRWRYAFVDQPLGRAFLRGGDGLFVCGDWCLGRSIESAWQSARAVVAAFRHA